MGENLNITKFNISNAIYIEKYYYDNVWEIKSVATDDLKDSDNNFLRIDYCNKGSFIGKFSDGSYSKIEAGFVALNKNAADMISHFFKLGFYDGISLIIDIDKLENGELLFFKEFDLSIESIRDRIPSDMNWVILDKSIGLSKIFENLDYFLSKADEVNDTIYNIIFLNIVQILCIIGNISFKKDEELYFSKKDLLIIKDLVIKLDKLEKIYSVTDLVKYSGFSRSKFYKLFYKIFAKSPGMYLKDYYLSKARYLLLNTDMSIVDIAISIGYSNPSKFSKCFKKEYQLSPSEYRRRQQEKIKGTRKKQKG